MKLYTKENLIAARIDYNAFLRLLEKEVIDLQEAQQHCPEHSLTTKNHYYNELVFLLTQLKKVMAIEASTTHEKIAKRLFHLLAGYPEKKTQTAILF
jgi:hypothetical protein